MKSKVLTFLIACFVGVICLAESEAEKPTKQEAVIKARKYLNDNTYVHRNRTRISIGV